MKIQGLTIVDDPKPWPNGDRLLAFFDVEFAGLRLRDCALIRVSRGFLLAQPPKGESLRGTGRYVQIIDPEIRKAMAEAAHNAFLALGGAEQSAV